MRSSLLRRTVLAAALAAVVSAAPRAAADRKLEIEWVDTLGGAATLIASNAKAPANVVTDSVDVLPLNSVSFGACITFARMSPCTASMNRNTWMSLMNARPIVSPYWTACALSTGSAPGSPRQVGHVRVLGGSPKPTSQPQNIFVRVESWTWISRPMTGS
jgi:hypothetical protein